LGAGSFSGAGKAGQNLSFFVEAKIPEGALIGAVVDLNDAYLLEEGFQEESFPRAAAAARCSAS